MNELPEVGSVHRGDCLDVLRTWRGGFVDLCYADPPHPPHPQGTLSGRGSRPAASPTGDPWRWDENAVECIEAIQRDLDNPAHDVVLGLQIAIGDCGIMAFLAYMATRLVEIKRVLKPTGSVYLHCPLAAGHYLKVVMDAVFGPRNFRSEIIWCDDRPYEANRRQFATAHEAILWYARRDRFAASLPTASGRPRIRCANSPGCEVPPTAKQQTEHLLHGNAESPSQGPSSRSLSWAFVPSAQERSGDGPGRSSGKPLELLERIIEVGSGPGDLVLDPFCGDRNTRAVASSLGRGWIGIGDPLPGGTASH